MHDNTDWNPTFTKLQPPTATNLRIRSVHDAHKLFHAVYLEKLPMVVRRLDAEERKLIKSGDVHVWEERGPSTEGLGLGIERWTDGKLWGPSRVRDNFLFYHEKEREPADFHGGSKWAKMLSGGVVVFRRRSRGEANPSAYTDTLDVSGNPMGMEMRVLHPNDPQQHSTFNEHLTGGGGNESNGVSSRDRLVKQTYSVLVKLPKDIGGVEVRKWHMTAYFAPNSSNPRPLRTIDDIPFLRELEIPEGMYQPARVGRGMGRHRSTAGLDPTGSGQSRGVHIPIDGDEPSLAGPGSDSGSPTPSDGSDREYSKNQPPLPVVPFRHAQKICPPPPSIEPSSENNINNMIHHGNGNRSVASTSNSVSVSVSGPPPLAMAISTMPVVPSQPPFQNRALQPSANRNSVSVSGLPSSASASAILSSHPSSSTSFNLTSPPPPSSPSTRSILSVSTSEPPNQFQPQSTSNNPRRAITTARSSNHQRFSPYNPPINRFNSNPPSPASVSARTSFDTWGGTRDAFSSSSSSSTCGKVQLPPLSCVSTPIDRDRLSSHSHSHRPPPSESVGSSSLRGYSSTSRSRSSSLSEAASSITQSLQTPRTNTPPRQLLIGGGSSSLSQFTGSRTYSVPLNAAGSVLKSEVMTSSPGSLPPVNVKKASDLVPLSFLEGIRSTQTSQYSLPIPYGPGGISARRAVDEAILKGLSF